MGFAILGRLFHPMLSQGHDSRVAQADSLRALRKDSACEARRGGSSDVLWESWSLAIEERDAGREGHRYVLFIPVVCFLT